MKIFLPNNGRIVTHGDKAAHLHSGSRMKQNSTEEPQSSLKVSTLSKRRSSDQLTRLKELLISTSEDSSLATVYRRIVRGMEDCPGKISDLEDLVQTLTDYPRIKKLLSEDSKGSLWELTDIDLGKLINNLNKLEETDNTWHTESLIQLQYALEAFSEIPNSNQQPCLSDISEYLKGK